MTKKTVIPPTFESPPPLFKNPVAEQKVVQPASRRKLHVTGNGKAADYQENALAPGVLAAGGPDTD